MNWKNACTGDGIISGRLCNATAFIYIQSRFNYLPRSWWKRHLYNRHWALKMDTSSASFLSLMHTSLWSMKNLDSLDYMTFIPLLQSPIFMLPRKPKPFIPNQSRWYVVLIMCWLVLNRIFNTFTNHFTCFVYLANSLTLVKESNIIFMITGFITIVLRNEKLHTTSVGNKEVLSRLFSAVLFHERPLFGCLFFFVVLFFARLYIKRWKSNLRTCQIPGPL